MKIFGAVLRKTFVVAGLCARICCACLCARTAHAATVTPAAATNYLFTTPLRPAHVKGVVMGSPPAYYVPRSEDFDWLNEAVQERSALGFNSFGAQYNFGTNTVLRPEFGKWGLAETNRFHRWVTAVDAAGVTNVVIGYNLVTNTPSSAGSPGPFFHSGPWPDVASFFYNPTATYGYHDSYLDPDVNLITTARAFDSVSPPFTNIYTVAYYTDTDPNTITNAFSTIEMPMTNGTVSVHTNRWETYKSVLSYYTVTTVVDLTALDYCHVGDGAFPGFTNAPPLPATFYTTVPVALSNSYVSLRGATRLAESGPYLYPTNRLGSVEADYFMGALSTIHTNSIASYKGRYAIGGKHYSVLDGYDETTREPIYEWLHTSYKKHTFPTLHVVTMPTRFPSALVTTGGVQRVTVEAAFVLVDFSYSLDVGTNRVADISKDVVVPVTATSILNTTGKIAYWESVVDARSLLDAAASASGAPSPPQDAASFVPARDNSAHWAVEWTNFILIYRIHPTSKFTDW